MLSSSQKKRKTWGLNKQSEEVFFLSANEQAAQHKFTRWKKGRGRRKMTWCVQNPLLVAGIHREMPTLLYKNNLLSFMCELHFCSQAADCIWRKTHNHTDWAPFKFMITNLKQDLVLPSNPTVCSIPSPMLLDENYVPLSSDLIFSLFLFLWENKCHQKSPCISTHHLYPPACPRTCIFCPLSWDYKRAMLPPKAKTCLCTLDQKHNSNNSTLSLYCWLLPLPWIFLPGPTNILPLKFSKPLLKACYSLLQLLLLFSPPLYNKLLLGNLQFLSSHCFLKPHQLGFYQDHFIKTVLLRSSPIRLNPIFECQRPSLDSAAVRRADLLSCGSQDTILCVPPATLLALPSLLACFLFITQIPKYPRV